MLFDLLFLSRFSFTQENLITCIFYVTVLFVATKLIKKIRNETRTVENSAKAD